jgi:GNAT superfamily N-acetyltransferase
MSSETFVIEVRPFDRGVIDVVQHLSGLFFDSALQSVAGVRMVDQLFSTERTFVSWVDQPIEKGERCLLLGYLNDVPVGIGAAFVTASTPKEPQAVIPFAFVEESARGIGVGGEILGKLIEWCEARTETLDVYALPGTRNWKSLLEAANFRTRLLVLTPRNG